MGDEQHILQGRVEVGAVGRRQGQNPIERIGGGEHEQDVGAAQQPQHPQHPGREMQGHGGAEPPHQQHPAGQHKGP